MLTQARLKDVLHYDSGTGVWTWRVTRPGPRKAGREAGCLSNKGYRKLSVDGKRYASGRLAWFYMTGEWPPDEVDHKDGNRSNDRWLNLRSATNEQNQYNMRLRSSNTSGFKGVHHHKQSGLWQARLGFKGCRLHLGTFRTPLAAHEAVTAARLRLHGEFARDK